MQVARRLRALAHHLHRLQDVLRLVVVGVAQIRGPAHVPVHLCQHLGKCRQRLHARIPVLGLGSGCNLFRRRVALRLPPTVGIRHLGRVSGRSQHLGDQRVRIECDRSYQLLQLLSTERLHLGLWLAITLLHLALAVARVSLLLCVRLLGVGLLLSVRLLLWGSRAAVRSLRLRVRLLPIGLGLRVALLPISGCY